MLKLSSILAIGVAAVLIGLVLWLPQDMTPNDTQLCGRTEVAEAPRQYGKLLQRCSP